MIVWGERESTPMPERISVFIGSVVAFHRPRKGTYYLFKWDPSSQKWYRDALEYPNLVVNRSNLHREASGQINVVLGRRNTHMIQFVSDGHYLTSGVIYIPILKATQRIPPFTIYKEYTAGVAEYLITDVRLWNVTQPAPPAAPAAPPQADPIPQRIAWLIAEDASKEKECCPITMNEISPIVAAVTSCFHVFERAALQEWMETKDSCPVCRKRCAITNACEL